MIIAHYANRPPRNYDLGFIRALTSERAPIWDARPELYFKAFLLREAGRFGAKQILTSGNSKCVVSLVVRGGGVRSGCIPTVEPDGRVRKGGA